MSQRNFNRYHDRNYLSRTPYVFVVYNNCVQCAESKCWTNCSTMLSTKSDDRVESRKEREREEKGREKEREISIIPRKRRVSTRGVREKERQMGWERRKERKGGGAVFWYSRRDSLEGIRVLFFAEKRNFAYLAGCRQGLDVNRLISVHESSRGGREARARNYLFASGFTRAPKEARSRSRAREPRELTSNNEAALFAPYPLLEIPFSSSANRKRNRCFGKRDSGNDAPSSS